MSEDSFVAPSLEVLAALLPAYDFEAFIAQGGMGAVYKARQRSLDRDVAIKILPRELGEDPEFRKSFETEAKAMARLNHPNLIGVYDFGDVDGMPYIVMELVNGKSLFHSAYNMAVDPIQAVEIVKGICDGLAHAHENGVIHRDIKPANILLTPRAVPKIGDFGLARPAGADGSGIVMGTPGYAAPEITRHPDHADRRSDLFALGVVLYELLIGRCPPYDGYQPPPSTTCGCDPALDRICEKAMHPVADLRYQSAEEMSEALDGWVRRAASPGALQPVVTPMKRPGRIGRPAPRETATYRPDSGGSGGLIKGLLMTAAAIVVVAIGWSKFNQMQKAKADAQASAGQRQPGVPEKTGLPDPALTKPKPADKEKPDTSKQASTEAPLESLARLKSDLNAGRRSEMPQGSIELGKTHFMVIPTPMTWQAAAAFAEKHGAHLFVASTEKDLESLSTLMPAADAGADAGLWIGAGSSGADGWSWVDGSSWQMDSKPEGKGSLVIVDGKGRLQARQITDLYPFAIQWQRDGTNPAALPEILRRAGESVASGTPQFPPGTLDYEGHAIYIATATSTYAKAAELAEKAGGHLVVSSSAEKDDWLVGQLPLGGAKDGFWIGAYRDGETWRWATEEPWGYSKWMDADQAGNHGGFAKIVPGMGWASAYSGAPAAGFIIEWDAAPAGDAAAGAEEKLPPEVAELEAKARDLLANLGKERDKELAANAKTFQWDLDTWLRDLSKNENAGWKRDVSLLKEMLKGNRVPEKVGAANGIRMSERMTKICERCAEKQKSIDSAFSTKAAKVRDSYVSRLKDSATKLEAAGDTKAAKAIASAIAKTEDLEGWLKSVEGDAQGGPGAQAEEKAGAKAAFGSLKFDGAVGRWAWIQKDIIVIREDGTLLNETNGYKGTWKCADRDSSLYELTWKKGELVDTMTLSSEGTDLAGTNQHGDKLHGWRIEKGDDTIVDAWLWGNVLCIFRNNKAVDKAGDSGTWELLSDKKGEKEYTVRWKSGWIDTFTLSNDEDSFSGTNNRGGKVSGRRAPSK